MSASNYFIISKDLGTGTSVRAVIVKLWGLLVPNGASQQGGILKIPRNIFY